jgi:hypothetical protein
VVTRALLWVCGIDLMLRGSTQRATDSGGREGQVKNASQTSCEKSDPRYMKPVPETGSTLSEGVGLVKPRGLSDKVVIGFPSK